MSHNKPHPAQHNKFIGRKQPPTARLHLCAAFCCSSAVASAIYEWLAASAHK